MDVGNYVRKELCEERSGSIREELRGLKSWAKAIALLVLAEIVTIAGALISGCFTH